MPPKSKKRQLELNAEKARDTRKAKKRRVSGEDGAESEVRSGDEGTEDPEDELTGLGVSVSEDALDTEDEAVDPTLDLDSSMKADTDHFVESL